MRNIFVMSLLAVMLAFALKRPQVGILAWIWVTVMNPHRLGYGWIYDLSINDFVAIVTLVSCAIHWQKRHSVEFSKLIGLLVVFYVWTTLTTIFAVDFELSFADWNSFTKTLLLFSLILLFMNAKHWIIAAIGVFLLSIAFFGVKGGLFTIVTAGQFRVYGPEGSTWSANNAVCMVMLVSIPLFLAFRNYFESRLARFAMTGAAVLSLASVLGTQSRGGWVGLLGMAMVMAIRSRRKLAMMLVIVTVLPVGYLLMSDSWKARMGTIATYQEDQSAMGRIVMWRYAVNIANERPLFGNGFEAFFYQPYYNRYLTDEMALRAVHSNYLQVLGEHGYIGLVLYLVIMATAFFSFGKWSRIYWNEPQTRWASPFLEMLQFSIVGYAGNGLTVNLAYLDMYYLLLAFGLVLISCCKVQTAATQQIERPQTGKRLELVPLARTADI